MRYGLLIIARQQKKLKDIQVVTVERVVIFFIVGAIHSLIERVLQIIRNFLVNMMQDGLNLDVQVKEIFLCLIMEYIALDQIMHL